MATRPLAFVTVVFESERLLLELQARSIAIFLVPELVAEIVVIDNSKCGLGVDARSRLLAEYGPLAPLVRFLRPADICDVPATTGWRSQQVFKLAVAGQLTSQRYVVLDAKNHFVAVPDLGYFEAPDGRARVNTYGYENHPLRPAFENVMKYLSLDPKAYLDRFTATVTPFVMDVPLVKAMMADIAQRGGTSFAKEFVANDLLEFFLYSGWIIHYG